MKLPLFLQPTAWRNQSDSDRGAANARIVAAQVAILFALSTSFPSATFAQTGTTQDSLLRAVSFAVTGSDANHVQITNQEKCVFTVKDMTVHFSNIDPSRVGFTPWRYLTGVVTKIEVHGQDTVVEQHSAAPSADYVFQVPTTEVERLQRAWGYIYSHGCKGAKSAF